MEMTIRCTPDFELTGDGGAGGWAGAEWQTLSRVGPGASVYRSRAKVMYSDKGLYFLFDCEDRRLTCSGLRDGDDIYQEDVVEVFLLPDASRTVYFEYEISPLGVELPLLIPNQQGRFMGWQPWHYQGERRVRRATTVRGGAKEQMAPVTGWTAEFFVPFELFIGIMPAMPVRGTRWLGNLYRIDYDEQPSSHWAWSPATGPTFHNHAGFGEIVFG